MDLPHAVNFESALLGAALVHPETATVIIEHLKPEHFYNARHKRITKAIHELWSKSEPIDLVTVCQHLADTGDGDESEFRDFRQYCTDLALGYYSRASIDYYVKEILNAAQKRALIKTATAVPAQAEDYDDARALISDHLQAVAGLTAESERGRVEHVAAILPEAIAGIKQRAASEARISGLSSGFEGLDDLTGGFFGGELIVIAGRTSMGKSALVLNIALLQALAGVTVFIASLEMSRASITNRWLSMLSGVHATKLRTGKGIEAWEWEQIARAEYQLAKCNLFVADESSGVRTVGDIRAKLATMRIGGTPAQSCVIDYIQLLHGDNEENRQQEVSEISRSCRQLAAEERIPVFALSQLSRKIEERKDKRPILSDLRESGSLEQDANVVIFIHREDYWDKESDRKGEAEIILSKHREADLGSVHLLFRRDTQQFLSKDGTTDYSPKKKQAMAPPAPPVPEKRSRNTEPPEIFPYTEEQMLALMTPRHAAGTLEEFIAELEAEYERIAAEYMSAIADKAYDNYHLAVTLADRFPAPPPVAPAEDDLGDWYTDL